MQLYWAIVAKRELSLKAKLSIYQSFYVPTLTYGHELWVMTEIMRLQVQAAEISFLHRVSVMILGDQFQSSDIWEILGVELLLLHVERIQLRYSGMSNREEPQGQTQDTLEGLYLLASLGTPMESPRMSCRSGQEK